MADTQTQLVQLFAPAKGELAPDLLLELRSILRLHSISPQELFYKWESYSIKMGGLDNLNVDTARDLKKDIQDVLERETRGKHARAADKRGVGATPRNARQGSDLFGMMDGDVSTSRVPMSGVSGNQKRRREFETPASKASKAHARSSPTESRNLSAAKDASVPFQSRTNAGEVVQTFNDHLDIPEPPIAPYSEPRIKLKANTDLSKFAYKPMAMKLSACSEVLDDRIDNFLSVVQEHHKLEDSAFGNAASQSTSEIVAVGRIASDTTEGKLTPGSIVLETSRRTGAGLRIPLRLDGVPSYDFFPGQIVAMRGSNASGEYFTVSEILEMPLLPGAASPVSDLEASATRMRSGGDESVPARPLNIIVSSGPYTADNNLDFEPLHALLDRANNTSADALVLCGPFLDVEHPLIAAGNIPQLPPSLGVSSDAATMQDVFRGLISLPIQRLTQAVPSITVILVPSVRDAVQKHASWPQDRLARKELSLPKQCSIVTNPVALSFNEFIIAISSQDILYELRREECVGGNLPKEKQDIFARLSRHLIEQRHFFPLYPPTSKENLPKPTVSNGVVEGEEPEQTSAAGPMLDISYLALAEWHHVKPDVLITPSALTQFIKVVNGVLVVNPGTLSKKKGPGSFGQMYVNAPIVSDEDKEEGQPIAHRLYERARVDVVRI
ncbi:MAG: DNA-directed DNA polymerase alpha subunit pol12 [Chrysothrix sp. TS-e1954]|nr:MAG: DNA-directed DNA polymerase alpha subunit pol12 [Chrysothrix sp. TS-e1954]